MDTYRPSNMASSAHASQADAAGIPSAPDSRARLLLTFLVLLLCSWLGIILSRQSEGVATIWLTNGMLFALVITRPRSIWIRYFLIGFLADTLADVLYGDPLRLAVGVSVANSIEVITFCLLLTRWVGCPLNLSK